MTRLKRKDLDFRQYLKKFSSLNYFNENRERAMKWCNYIPKKKKKKKKIRLFSLRRSKRKSKNV